MFRQIKDQLIEYRWYVKKLMMKALKLLREG